jgi:hypothetical protein
MEQDKVMILLHVEAEVEQADRVEMVEVQERVVMEV